MIDTHTHIYLPEFDADRAEVVRRAEEAGVTMMILPNVDLSTIAPMRELHARHPRTTAMAMGLHPSEVNDASDNALRTVIAELKANASDYVAVGEIGMDLYWDATYREKQMRALEAQCEVAVKMGLPVIIHCREALDATLEVMEQFRGRLGGVFHCFAGTADDVEAVRRRAGDFYFGIGGVVTFKNSHLRESLPAIGLDRILLETDAPYLAPVPHRGKRNESAYLTHTMQHVADNLGVTAAEVDRVTTDSARSLFRV